MNSDKKPDLFFSFTPRQIEFESFWAGGKNGQKKRVNKQLESYYVHPQDKIQKKITISQNFSPQS